MGKRLSEAGFVTLNQSYPSRTGTISELSEAAVGSALKEKRFAQCSKIHFVTHSLGGILVRDYFKRHPEQMVGRVVMLGPPNQGSEVVDRIGHWKIFRKLGGPAGRQLGTGKAAFSNQLGKVNFELGVIAGNRSFNWINSLMIPGADDGKVAIQRTKVEGMKELTIVPASHPFIMKKKQVITLTIQFLKHGSFKVEG